MRNIFRSVKKKEINRIGKQRSIDTLTSSISLTRPQEWKSCDSKPGVPSVAGLGDEENKKFREALLKTLVKGLFRAVQPWKDKRKIVNSKEFISKNFSMISKLW